MTAHQPEVTCSLDAEALERRRTELRRGLLSRVVDTRPLDASAGDGLALALPAGDDTQRELEELIDFESRCCGFASYTIHAEPERSLLWLEAVGPTGTRALFEQLAGSSERVENAARNDRSARAGRVGLAGAGGAALALVLCASPALPVVLGAFGIGASFSSVAGWIDSFAPPLLIAGLAMSAWAMISRRRRRAT